MSKHVGRKQRWAQLDARTWSSNLGRVAYLQNAWYALLEYKTPLPPELEGSLASWQPQARRMGPFMRPRNAMVALEREAAFLKNRHGKGILFGDRLWAEA
jgi:hypothetical protein